MQPDNFARALTDWAYRCRASGVDGDQIEAAMRAATDAIGIACDDVALRLAADLGVLPLEEFAPPASG